MKYVVEPVSQPAESDATLTALVTEESSEHALTVVVVISRAADAPPVRPSEIDVHVVDADGRERVRLEGPAGIFVEVGGSLGTSASGTYVFASDDVAPDALVIDFLGARVTFRVRPE